MIDPLHILFDDRPFIEVASHEMRGRADQLHPALVRAGVGPCALEAGQEAVMDIDAAPRKPIDQLGREHLHVARQDQVIRPAILDQR